MLGSLSRIHHLSVEAEKVGSGAYLFGLHRNTSLWGARCACDGINNVTPDVSSDLYSSFTSCLQPSEIKHFYEKTSHAGVCGEPDDN
ncbi:MAG TPA: hypothetical protein DEF41_01245 [Desulfovibrio sp.]|nr:hypothetical protein [Desulfovibrio sp.]